MHYIAPFGGLSRAHTFQAQEYMAIGGQLANPRKPANGWIVEELSGCKDPNSGRWLSYN